MKLQLRHVLPVIFLSLVSTTSALADDSDLSNYSGGWVNLGLGVAAASNSSGIGGDIGLNYAPSSSRLWTLRTSTALNFTGILGDVIIGNGDGNDDTPSDVALMYGLMRKNTDGYVSASTGLALVDDQTPGISINGVTTQQESDSYTVGFPIELQAFLTPIKYVGVGLIGFGDLNAKRSFGGVALALQFGKLN